MTHAPNRFTLQVSLAAAGAAFLLFRIAGLLKDNELEDQDSVGIISAGELLRAFDLAGIMDHNPDTNMLYPVLMALVSLVTGDMEFAARLVSLGSSVLAAVAVLFIAKRMSMTWAGVAAVFIMACNPYLIRFSYSTVSEPIYCAVFAWALYFFLVQLRAPTLRGALILGVLAGLGFGSRFESILLFASLPFILLFYQRVVAGPAGQTDWPRLGKAGLVYVLVFMAIAAPQVWRVSEKMNTFSLTGRFVWQALLDDSGRTYQAKLHGLDYSPYTTNIYYLREHPEAADRLLDDQGFGDKLEDLVHTVVLNLEELHDLKLALLTGVPVCVFAVVGFLAMLRSAVAAEGVVIVLFMAIGLVAPLTNRVDLDHIALIAAPLSLLSGIGIYDAAKSLAAMPALQRVGAGVVGVALVVLAVAPYSLGLSRLYGSPDDANPQYELETVRELAAVVREDAREIDGRPGLTAAHSYLAHYAGAAPYSVPWTEFPGLITFMKGNGIRYLYFDEEMRSRPFAEALDSPAWNRAFELVYESEDAAGEWRALYRLRL